MIIVMKAKASQDEVKECRKRSRSLDSAFTFRKASKELSSELWEIKTSLLQQTLRLFLE